MDTLVHGVTMYITVVGIFFYIVAIDAGVSITKLVTVHSNLFHLYLCLVLISKSVCCFMPVAHKQVMSFVVNM